MLVYQRVMITSGLVLVNLWFLLVSQISDDFFNVFLAEEVVYQRCGHSFWPFEGSGSPRCNCNQLVLRLQKKAKFE